MPDAPERDPLLDGLTVYEVGGAVRDALLGRAVTDRDYVVVGATPEVLECRGFRRVGRDFPVFLHPKTGAEYALARTERKTGAGHGGFECFAAPDVTLEQDLARRDLTVNAMARTTAGEIVDPFGGRDDLLAGSLRHVSPAFVEDPLRVLRVARFAAQLGFEPAPETEELMREMAASGELDTLTPERVWTETSKALAAPWPAAYFEVLARVGAIAAVFPELGTVMAGAPDAWQQRLAGLKRSAAADDALPVRAAIAFSIAGPQATQRTADRLRLPRAIREVAYLAAREGAALTRAEQADAGQLLELVKTADALRRPDRLHAALTAACRVEACDPEPPRRCLDGALAALAGIDLASVAGTASEPSEVPKAVEAARLAAIERYLDRR